jgi:hypothetical protein
MLLNTGLQIHKHGTIIISAELGKTMAGIASVIKRPNDEFGVYLKGTFNPVTCTVTVEDEYYFPRQQCTPGSIQFLEEPPSPSWNVVMHRHPNGCTKFSSVDVNSINEEFLASILYIPTWSFPDAVINVPLATGSKLQINAKVYVNGSLCELCEDEINIIRANMVEPVIVKDINKVRKHSGIDYSKHTVTDDMFEALDLLHNSTSEEYDDLLIPHNTHFSNRFNTSV